MALIARLTLPLLLLAALTLQLGCANGEFRFHDPLGRQAKLEDAHKAYTDYVRWSKFQEASAFIERDQRAEFLSQMPDFEQVRFTDWEAPPIELDDEMTEATMVVTYTGYSLRMPVMFEIQETQHWTRARGNDWRLTSSFEGLERLAGN